MGLSFTNAAGPGPRICNTQGQVGPVIPPGTGFPFRRLLLFAGLRTIDPLCSLGTGRIENISPNSSSTVAARGSQSDLNTIRITSYGRYLTTAVIYRVIT
jgi:hypothetical protein